MNEDKIFKRILLGGTLFALLLAGFAACQTARADDDSDSDGPKCHKKYVTWNCLPETEDGQDGTNGTDGQDGANGQGGADGADGSPGTTGPAGPMGPEGPPGEQGPEGSAGTDGKDGKDGKDGRDGLDGVVPNQWYNDIRGHMAATSAMQVYLPQDKNSRLTIGTSRVMGRTGVGVGYAYRADNESKTAFTLALGRANGARVVQLGVSVEF